MARIAGINIPSNQHLEIGLTSIFGVGRSRAREICKVLNIPCSKKVKDLNDDELENLRAEVNRTATEGDLRREVSMNIKRLVDLACYRGSRHKKKLPVRGQRTQCNARTRKGKAIAIAGKKLTPLKK